MVPRLQDIAQRAGVSSATVSMALNNKKGVSPEKAREIRRIAEELGYLKIQDADVSGQTLHFIQILKPSQDWDDNYRIFIAEYLEGVTTAAARENLQVEIRTFETEDMESIRKELEAVQGLGILFLGAGLYPEDAEILSRISSPHVFIDVCCYGVNSDFIDMDNKECVYSIVHHLINQGYDSIGLVQAEFCSPNFILREEAFRSTLKDFDFHFESQWKVDIPIDQQKGKDAIKSYLRSVKKLPRAFFCVNDMIAYNLIHACEELSISVPGQLAVAGFDDLPASKIIRPRLTTVNVSKKVIAMRGVRKLIEGAKFPIDRPREKLLISGKLILGEST